jgi:hypothetical protein
VADAVCDLWRGGEPERGGYGAVGQAILVAEHVDVRLAPHEAALATDDQIAAHCVIGAVHATIAVEVVVLHHLYGRALRQAAHLYGDDAGVIVAHDAGGHGELSGKYEPLRAVWERHFAPRHAINLGYNGYRTEHILWNLRDGELDFAVSPKVAILLIGTNNSDDRHFSKVHTAEEILAGTKAIVDLIKRRHPTTKILVMRIFPRGGDAEKGESPPAFNSSA